jgi:hypothetical protein
MNIRKLKEKLVITLIGVAIVSAWVVYAIITQFNFVAFITNPTTISIVLILIVPLSFLLADYLWGNEK